MKKTPPRLEDLRVPNIGKVPEGSYLITGLPRIRSAWLSALLTRDDCVCYHEAPTLGMPALDDPSAFGLCDPGAASLYPNFALKAFDGRKMVIIERAPSDSRRALEKFAGMEATNWDAIEARYNHFRRYAVQPLVVKFKQLSDYRTVNKIHLFVLGWSLTRQRFDFFDGLRIEQDVMKRAQAEARAAIAS